MGSSSAVSSVLGGRCRHGRPEWPSASPIGQGLSEGRWYDSTMILATGATVPANAAGLVVLVASIAITLVWLLWLYR